MNRSFFSLFAAAVVLLWIGPAPAWAACPDPETADSTNLLRLSDAPLSADSLERLDTVDTDLVALHRTSDGDEVVLEVGGFGLTLAGLSAEKRHERTSRLRKPRVNLIALAGTELGFNLPTGIDYAAYPSGTERFFDLDGGGSFHFSSTLVGLDIGLGKRQKSSLMFGLRYTVDNYRLSNRAITLGNDAGGKIVPVALDGPADKSKLRVTSLGIPLSLVHNPVKGLSLSLTGYFDFTMGSRAIYKKPKVRESLSGINPFRFGIGGAVTYYNVGFYIRYSVTPLFEKGMGPVVRPLSVGICLAL